MAAVARYRFTRRADGDFAIDGDPDALRARRRHVVDGPWTWLHQVHGAAVVTVDEPGAAAGAVADAAVTATPGAVLCVQVADCAPVVLVGEGGAGPSVGVAHVGWRGLAAGVLDEALAALRGLGADHVHAVVGPHIGPECYEFGDDELRAVEAALGARVRATTATGQPALDLGAGIDEALRRAGVVDVERVGACTACRADDYFSYRARRESQRLAAVAWLGSGA